MPNTDLIVRPRERDQVRDLVKLKKLEIRAAREARLTEMATGILASPAVQYVALVLLLEYLCTHPKNKIEIFGIGGGGYISKDTAKVVTGGLTAGLAANALGGAAGITSIIKAFKG